MPTVSYASSFLATITVKLKSLIRKSKLSKANPTPKKPPKKPPNAAQAPSPTPPDPPEPEDPLSLIDFDDLMTELGLHGIRSPDFHPSNLDADQVRHLLTFIDATLKEEDSKKAAFVQFSPKVGAGRTAYKKWFPSISRKFNKRVEEAMQTAGCHPLQLLDASEDDTLPALDPLTSNNLVNICNNLFGDVALDFNETIVDENLHSPLSTVVLHNFRRLAKQHTNAKPKVNRAVSHMLETMQAVIDAESPSLAQVQAAHGACLTVKTISPWYPNKHKLADVNLGYLEGVLESVLDLPPDYFDNPARILHDTPGGDPEEAFHAKKAQGRKKKKLHPDDVSNAAEIKRTLDLFLTHIESCDNYVVPTRHDKQYVEDFLKCGDMGVDEFRGYSTDELCALLRFADALPPTWPRFLKTDGQTTWTPGIDTTLFDTGGPGFKKNALLWHQLVGVASIVSKMWTATPSTCRIPGTLLADGVGVGKTAQMLATIAFVQMVWQMEQEGMARPPLIKDLPCFMGKGKVDNRPHLIVVPPTLVGQWHREAKTFFRHGGVDIFVVPTNAKKIEALFTDKSSRWFTSGLPMMQRIVICSHATFTTLASKAYNLQRGGINRPPDHPRQRKTDSIGSGTLFDFFWSVVGIDEGHLWRGPARGLFGATQLQRIAECVHVMTATPLYTKPNDLCNIARMIGHPDFCGEEGLAFEKTMTKKIDASRRSITPAQRQAQFERGVDLIKGNAEELPTDSLRATKYSVVKEIQQRLGLYVVRRTLKSTKPDGSPLNTMPPVESHTIFITLREEELLNLDIIIEGIERVAGVGVTASDFSLENFWITYRTGVTYYIVPKGKYPVFAPNGIAPDGTVYDKDHSTKIRVLIELVSHHLEDDQHPHALQDDKHTITYPKQPRAPGEQVPQSRKILIYAEFTMQHATIASIFRLHGIDPYVIHGNVKQDTREKVVESFVNGTDPKRRVLIFSGVGAAGLNLSCADVVILLDACWSQVQIEQIIGRAARLTQEKPVHVYHLLALDTTDIMMTTMAREKGDMLDDFFSRDRNVRLDRLLNGEEEDDGSTMYDVGSPTGTGRKKMPNPAVITASAAGAGPSTSTGTGDQIVVDAGNEGKKARGGRKKKISPAQVSDTDMQLDAPPTTTPPDPSLSITPAPTAPHAEAASQSTSKRKKRTSVVPASTLSQPVETLSAPIESTQPASKSSRKKNKVADPAPMLPPPQTTSAPIRASQPSKSSSKKKPTPVDTASTLPPPETAPAPNEPPSKSSSKKKRKPVDTASTLPPPETAPAPNEPPSKSSSKKKRKPVDTASTLPPPETTSAANEPPQHPSRSSSKKKRMAVDTASTLPPPETTSAANEPPQHPSRSSSKKKRIPVDTASTLPSPETTSAPIESTQPASKSSSKKRRMRVDTASTLPPPEATSAPIESTQPASESLPTPAHSAHLTLQSTTPRSAPPTSQTQSSSHSHLLAQAYKKPKRKRQASPVPEVPGIETEAAPTSDTAKPPSPPSTTQTPLPVIDTRSPTLPSPSQAYRPPEPDLTFNDGSNAAVTLPTTFKGKGRAIEADSSSSSEEDDDEDSTDDDVDMDTDRHRAQRYWDFLAQMKPTDSQEAAPAPIDPLLARMKRIAAIEESLLEDSMPSIPLPRSSSPIHPPLSSSPPSPSPQMSSQTPPFEPEQLVVPMTPLDSVTSPSTHPSTTETLEPTIPTLTDLLSTRSGSLPSRSPVLRHASSSSSIDIAAMDLNHDPMDTDIPPSIRTTPPRSTPTKKPLPAVTPSRIRVSKKLKPSPSPVPSSSRTSQRSPRNPSPFPPHRPHLSGLRLPLSTGQTTREILEDDRDDMDGMIDLDAEDEPEGFGMHTLSQGATARQGQQIVAVDLPTSRGRVQHPRGRGGRAVVHRYGLGRK